MRIVAVVLFTTALFGQNANVPMTIQGTQELFGQKLRQGKSDDAEVLARQFLAQEERANRPESPELQFALDLILEVFGYRNDRSTPEVNSVGARALALREKLQGPDAVLTGQTLRLYSIALVVGGQYSAARATIDRALNIFMKLERAGHVFTRDETFQYSKAYNVLAGILDTMMDWNGAKRALLKSVELRQSVSASSSSFGVTLLNLGRLEHQSGNHAEALVQFSKSRGMLLVQKTRDDSILAELQAAEAVCVYETGRKAEGLAMLESALEAREKIHGASDTSIAPTIEALSERYREEGRFAEAKKLTERALAINRKGYATEHPIVAEGEAYLSLLLAETGDSRASLQHALEAERIAREHLVLSVATLPEREATLFALKRVSAMSQAVSVAVDLRGDTVESVYDALVRSRALVFDELASRHRVQALATEDSQLITKLTDELRGARERLARLAIASPDQAETLHKAIEERDSLDRKLAGASVQYRRRTTARTAGLKDVVAGLPEATALVSFIQFNHSVKGTIQQPAEYAAFILTKGPPAVVGLGSASEINSAVDEMRAKLAVEAAAPGIAIKRNEAAYRVAAERLRKLVWDPIDRYVAGSKRVFIVPDGALHTINFAALPEAGVEGRYLIERGAPFHYLSTERDLVKEKAPDAAGVGLLAVGNPTFNRPELARGRTAPENGSGVVAGNSGASVFRGTRSNCSALQTMQFTDLPSSGREVEAISRLWKRGSAGEVVELTGELAGPERFKAMAPGRRTIHLAVHGFVAGTDCTDPLRNENPLLLTGLALAGANKRGATGEDGILTAEEIASLDLRGVEWAVLSACETGLGKATQTEGVFGLRRAFQIAGAHTVIMSLWPVEDKVTTEWMQTLYEQRLSKRMDTANSVRSASLETLKRRRAAGQGTHPFYWAPFVAVGDWR